MEETFNRIIDSIQQEMARENDRVIRGRLLNGEEVTERIDYREPQYIIGESETLDIRSTHGSLNDYKVTTNAKEQFIEVLTKKQQEWYERSQFIKAIGSNGGKYIIYCQHTSRMNIWDYKNPMRYCISMHGAPLFSVFLAQKLLIETNEEKFLELSNHYKWVERDEDYSTAGWRCIHKGMLGNACNFVLP